MEVLLSFILISLIVLFLSLAGTTVYNSYVNNRQLEFNKAYMLSNLVIDIDAISAMFDVLINDCVMEYLLFNPINEDVYINAEKEREIITDITSKVIFRLTDEILSKLSLIYVINTEEELSDIITTKVYIRVTDFVVSHNTMQQ